MIKSDSDLNYSTDNDGDCTNDATPINNNHQFKRQSTAITST